MHTIHRNSDWIPGFMLNWWDYCLGKHFTKGWANLMKESPKNTKPYYTIHFLNAMALLIWKYRMLKWLTVWKFKMLKQLPFLTWSLSLDSCQLQRNQDFTSFYIYRCIFKIEIEKDIKGEELEGKLTPHIFLTIFLQLLSLKSLTLFFSGMTFKEFLRKKKINTNE